VVSNAIYQSEYFGSYAFFAEHYKVPIEKNKTKPVCWNSKPSQSVYFTSDKEQVLKTYGTLGQVFYCDMEPEQEKLYEEEKSKARNALLKPMVLALTKSTLSIR
jgi:non-specific serine/threonine protein kinase